MGLETLVVILAGGTGSRLLPLTKFRIKPAVPIGGKFRLIDIPCSNAINSDLKDLLVLTQGKDKSFGDHMGLAWPSSRKFNHYIELMTPQEIGGVYEGDADAVRQIRERIVNNYKPKNVLILPGDHLLKMDYRPFLRFLQESGADAAIAMIPKPLDQSRHLGAMAVDGNNKVTDFREKEVDTPLRARRREDHFYASMGIYAFKTEALINAVELEGNLFGKDIIPRLIGSMRITGYDYQEKNKIRERRLVEKNGVLVEEEVEQSTDSFYWRDVGTIEQYFNANMDLVMPAPEFNLYGDWKFKTIDYEAGPAKVVNAPNCIASEGAIITHVTGNDVVIGPFARAHRSHLERVIIFNHSLVQHSKIRNTIIDKDVKINGMEIGYDPKADIERGIFVDEESGIRVIPKKYSLLDPTTWYMNP